jgi:hypothetical protein
LLDGKEDIHAMLFEVFVAEPHALPGMKERHGKIMP